MHRDDISFIVVLFVVGFILWTAFLIASPPEKKRECPVGWECGTLHPPGNAAQH